MPVHSESLRRPAARALSALTAPAAAVPIAGAALLVCLAVCAAGLTGSIAAGAFLALAALAAWTAPEALLLVLIAAAPVARSPVSGLVSGDVLAPAKVAVMTLLVVVLALRRGDRPAPPLPAGVAPFLGFWFGVTVLATLHAVDVRIAALYVAMAAAGLWSFLAAHRLDRRWRRRLIFGALAAAVPIACLVLLQYVVVEHHRFGALQRFIIEPRTIAFQQFAAGIGTDRSYRPSGTMPHPNAMGLAFAVLLPFAMSLVTVRGLGRARRAAALGTAALLFTALLATNSRAALLTAIVAVGFLCLHRGYRHLALAGAALLMITGLFYLSPERRETARQTLVEVSRVRYGLSGRNDIWRKSAELIRQSPWLGVGPGNFPAQFVSRFGFFTPQDELEQMGQVWMIHALGPKVVQNFNAHNLYLQTWGELGFLGPLLFLGGVGLAVALGEARARRRRRGSYPRAVALAATASAFALLVYGVFDSQVAITQSGLNILFGALLGASLRV